MLKPRRKIMRKEIKKDPVLEKLAQAEQVLRTRSRLIGIATLVLVAGVVLTSLFWQSKKSANVEAAGELGLALLAIQGGDLDAGMVALENVVDKFKNTSSAGMAVLTLGRNYLAKNDFTNARVQFEKYIKSYKHDHFFTAIAYNGLGICAEQDGDIEAAVKYFENAGNAAPYKFQKQEYQLNCARNLMKLNQIDKAEKYIRKVLDGEPEFTLKNTAEILLGQIDALKG